MKYRILTAAILMAFLAFPQERVMAEQRQSGRYDRQQTRAIEMHDVQTGTLPSGEVDEREPAWRQRPYGSAGDDAPDFRRSPSPASSFSVQTPPPREERRSRNWLLPALPDDVELGDDPEPTGWGWLADDVNRRLRAEQESELREEEDESATIESLLLERGEPGIYGLPFGEMTSPENAILGIIDLHGDETFNAHLLEQALSDDDQFLNRLSGMAMDGDQGEERSADNDFRDSRWGMDQVWGINEEGSGGFLDYEPPVQSHIPSVSENIRSHGMMPDMQGTRYWGADADNGATVTSSQDRSPSEFNANRDSFSAHQRPGDSFGSASEDGAASSDFGRASRFSVTESPRYRSDNDRPSFRSMQSGRHTIGEQIDRPLENW